MRGLQEPVPPIQAIKTQPQIDAMSEAEKQEYNELLSRLVYDYHTAVNYLMLDIEQELACKRVLRLTPKGIEAARALSENK